MGFLERAHYRGWQLTSTAQQLPLWTPSEVGEIEPDVPARLDEPKRENRVLQRAVPPAAAARRS